MENKSRKKHLEFVMQEGEGLKIEFKESLDKSLAKEIAAFANSEGGRIFLGVRDDGAIKGVHATNELKSRIQDIARNCDPAISIRLTIIGGIIAIEVDEGNDKPYKC